MDTNVLLAAHISESGASHKILRLIINERIDLALSTQILLEYDDFSFPSSSVTAIKLRSFTFKNNAFSAVYESLVTALQMIFCVEDYDVFE